MALVEFKDDYEGERNDLSCLLFVELHMALRNVDKAVWDDISYLDIQSPYGTSFRIFVDCFDFDYFEWADLPNGLRLEYGHPALREIEYNWGADENELFRKLIHEPRGNVEARAN